MLINILLYRGFTLHWGKNLLDAVKKLLNLFSKLVELLMKNVYDGVIKILTKIYEEMFRSFRKYRGYSI